VKLLDFFGYFVSYTKTKTNKIRLIDFPPEVFPPGKNFLILSWRSLINSSTFGGVGPLPDPLPLPPPPGGDPQGLWPLKSSDMPKYIVSLL